MKAGRADYSRLLPTLNYKGKLVFKDEQVKQLRAESYYDILPQLIKLFKRSSGRHKPVRTGIEFLDLLFRNPEPNKSIVFEIIDDWVNAANRVTGLAAPRAFCTQCLHYSHRQVYELGPISWRYIVCTSCYQIEYLNPFISSLHGYVGVPDKLAPAVDAFWYDVWNHATTDVNLSLEPLASFSIYPGLGDKLDWVVSAVVNDLLNRDDDMPPIFLQTIEPLTENTRRLIAPYLNDRSV